MNIPSELYTVVRRAQFAHEPVLIHAFYGFVDAGGGARLAVEHILATCEHHTLATFDVDQVMDYRARRPKMRFVRDHFESADIDQIVLYEVMDAHGTGFLLLVGPEPDYQWQRFIAAVNEICTEYRVRLSLSLAAIPWPSPHTRPLGIAVHGNEPALLAGFPPVVGEIEVPGHVGAMLELDLGRGGKPSIGITAQVPHYLVQFEYPRAAQVMLDGVAATTGLSLSAQSLEAAAKTAEDEVAAQLAVNEEFSAVVVALEEQYDQATLAMQTLGGDSLPSGDEIAAQVEEFLSGIASDPEKEQ